MLVLDTDVVSILQANPTPRQVTLATRLRESGELVWVTIVTLQEQLRGRLAHCTAAQTPEEYVEAAARLRKTWDDYRRRLLLDFDADAAQRLAQLKRVKVRIGTQDLRIAAVALVHDATLITRNLTDFRKVPGLRAEDWTTA